MKKQLSKRNTILLILIICFFIGSCKKENEDVIIVKGTVLNPKNNSPISGAKVYLDGKILNSGIYNDNYSEITSATSDAAGNFEINTPFQVVSGYRIRVFKNNYFENSTIVASDLIGKGDTYTTSLNLVPVAWIKVNLNNVVNWPDDEINYKFTGATQSCIDCCHNQFLQGVGNYHAIYKCKLIGDSYGRFYWTVKRDGATNPFADSVYCTAFDTTVLNINY